MANREKGEASFTVKGATYTIVLNFAAMAAAEEALSSPSKDVAWTDVWRRVAKGQISAIRALLWAMLQKHHPALTLPDVDQLIVDMGGLSGLSGVLDAAAKAVTADARDQKELGVGANPPRARTKRGTGGASTPPAVASV